MDILTEVIEQIAAVRDRLGAVEDVTNGIRELSDETVIEIVGLMSDATRKIGSVESVAVGVIAERSTREAGQDGLAQKNGHRTATSFVQTVTGTGKAAATRQIRVGRAVLEGAPACDSRPALWHAPIAAALLAGSLTTEQGDAIRMGLDEPPEGMEDEWRRAAHDLTIEAAERTVEELRSQARLLRDMIDPDGAERRFLARYDARSFRSWTTAVGTHKASIVFDDEGFAIVSTIEAAALRPRRGGPRFVDSAEREAAKKLVDDPRTNEQLLYDLMLDLLNVGALADAETVHGTRKAGVRVVTVVGDRAQNGAGAPGVAAAGTRGNPKPRGGAAETEVGVGAGYTGDGMRPMPQAAIEQRMCDTGTVRVTVNSGGDPLNVGRERRLFTTAQRVALAARDGGCRWPECESPASYCEAHHIDPYSEGGRTDVDRGILLCRFHHMHLHHQKWRITREGMGDFRLRGPNGEVREMRRRIALRRMFENYVPPPRRFRQRE